SGPGNVDDVHHSAGSGELRRTNLEQTFRAGEVKATELRVAPGIHRRALPFCRGFSEENQSGDEAGELESRRHRKSAERATVQDRGFERRLRAAESGLRESQDLHRYQGPLSPHLRRQATGRGISDHAWVVHAPRANGSLEDSWDRNISNFPA